MIQLIFSFFVSGLGILFVFTGLFFITSPRDMLTVRYQNWRLSSTGRALKDEDFPRVGRLVSTLKLSGFLFVIIGIGILYLAFSG